MVFYHDNYPSREDPVNFTGDRERSGLQRWASGFESHGGDRAWSILARAVSVRPCRPVASMRPPFQRSSPLPTSRTPSKLSDRDRRSISRACPASRRHPLAQCPPASHHSHRSTHHPHLPRPAPQLPPPSVLTEELLLLLLPASPTPAKLEDVRKWRQSQTKIRWSARHWPQVVDPRFLDF